MRLNQLQSAYFAAATLQGQFQCLWAVHSMPVDPGYALLLPCQSRLHAKQHVCNRQYYSIGLLGYKAMQQYYYSEAFELIHV